MLALTYPPAHVEPEHASWTIALPSRICSVDTVKARA